MQIVAVPLYDQGMAVVAYIFRYMKENNLFSAAQATNIFDGATNSEALRVLDQAGLEAFTMGLPIFVPINPIMLMGRLHTQCGEPADKIIFVIEESFRDDQVAAYMPIVLELRSMGYRFAANYPYDFNKRDEFMENCSYIFLSQREEKREHTERALNEIKTSGQNLIPIATHIYSESSLLSLYEKGYGMYESRFYHIPVESAISVGNVGGGLPALKHNAIRLINMLLDEASGFDSAISMFDEAPGLTASLLQFVNSLPDFRVNKAQTISQALTALGRQETKKWMTATVAKPLGVDKPREITKISLVRAKFAENLAPLFKMPGASAELFLTGLFSVLDIMLEKPMGEAAEMLYISEDIFQAIVSNTGRFAGVMQMVVNYENAKWSEISRSLILENINENDLSKAYIDAIAWFGNFIVG